MKPSEVLQRADFQFEIIGEGDNRQYRPFDACVKASMPWAGPDTIPLTNGCPLFVGTTEVHIPTQIVNEELPEGAKLPKSTGVYFLTDAINTMAYKLEMPKERIAEVLERIEQRFKLAGLDERGHWKRTFDPRFK